MLILVLLMGQAPLKEKVLEAERLELRDRSGNLRASLEVLEKGSGMRFFDVNGKVRMTLTVLQDGPMVMMVDSEGHRMAEIGGRDQGPGLVLYGDHDTIETELSLLPTGNRLRFYDNKGGLRASLGLIRGGQPWLAMGSDTGKPQLEIGGPPEGASMRLYDKAGMRRWAADTGGEGPSLFLMGPDGRARAGMTVTGTSGDVALFDPAGKTVSSLQRTH